MTYLLCSAKLFDMPQNPYGGSMVTTSASGVANMPNVRDHDLSMYLRLQGDGLSVGGYEPNPDMLPQVIYQRVQALAVPPKFFNNIRI